MKTSILFLRAITTAAALTVWLGVVLKNHVVHVDAAFLLNHQRMMPSSSSSLLFSKRTLSTTSSLTATKQQQQQNKAQQQQQQQIPCLEWTVYVDQSEASLDKGGSATLDAFLGLAPASTVQVKAALLPMGSYYAPPNYGSSSTSSNGNNNNNNINSVGPFVRCIPLRRERNINEADDDDDDNNDDSRRAFDVCNVDSVDKVYRILTKHMRVKGVTTAACDCLKWKYKANGFLEAGQISLAIEAYDKALEIVAASKTTQQQQQQQRDNNNSTTTSNAASSSSSSSSISSSLQHQEGALYLMRATAFLQRARRLRKELKGTMLKLSNLVSSSSSTSSLSKSHQRVTATLLKTVAKMAHVDPSNSNINNNNKNNAQTGQEKPKEEEKEQTSIFSSFWGGSKSSISSSSSSTSAATNNAATTVAALQQSIFRRILRDAQSQEFQFRRTLYMHGLYQHALLQAAQDALYSTELLPEYPSAWQQAGDVFSDLWKLPEGTLFYQRAIQLDNDDYDENDKNGDSSSSRPQRRRLETTLKPVIERLKRRQQLLDQARSYYGWSEDTLRLALDVAATSMIVDLK